MSPIARSLAAVGVAPLLALSLTACGSGGGGGGAPTDASVDDFCSVEEEFEGIDGVAEGDYEGFASAASSAADKLEEVGTPEDISEEAREGFETMIDVLGGLDAGAMEEAITQAQESGEADQDSVMQDVLGVDADQLESINAFNEYASETC